VSRPPFPPYPPYPPFPPHSSPPAYPPYAPYPPVVNGGEPSIATPQGLSHGAGPPAGIVEPPRVIPPGPDDPADSSTPFPGNNIKNPLSIFFNYGRYDVVNVTNEGLGQGQSAKLTKFVEDATRVKASEITVNGFASPEDNLPNAQLPLNRATALKNLLDQRFATGPVKPTVTVKTTSVLSGDQSTWPSLRRADIYIVSPTI
jgi:hypothetical protein